MDCLQIKRFKFGIQDIGSLLAGPNRLDDAIIQKVLVCAIL
jgi:hypothetical protein